MPVHLLKVVFLEQLIDILVLEQKDVQLIQDLSELRLWNDCLRMTGDAACLAIAIENIFGKRAPPSLEANFDWLRMSKTLSSNIFKRTGLFSNPFLSLMEKGIFLEI